jgi:hypothetical protein
MLAGFKTGIALVGGLFYVAARISVYAMSGMGLVVHCKGF